MLGIRGSILGKRGLLALYLANYMPPKKKKKNSIDLGLEIYFGHIGSRLDYIFKTRPKVKFFFWGHFGLRLEHLLTFWPMVETIF